MDLEANILFKDVVDDTDPEDVAYRLQCCANEWFYPEVTKTMPEVHVSIAPPPEAPSETQPQFEPQFEPLDKLFANQPPISPSPFSSFTLMPTFAVNPQPQPEKPARRVKPRPIYIVSDLHLGDGGPRDNFAHMSNGFREIEFMAFLDFVEKQHGRLIIVGDLFELWQSNISLVLTLRERLLDRLAAMEAIYVLGNHDADLLYFCSEHQCSTWLRHPFFKTMRTEHTERINDRSFHFIHGHEVDYYCADDNPGLGRITAIYSGLREDRNGSPLLNKYKTVEARSIGRFERLSNFVRWLCGKPNRMRIMNLGLCDYIREFGVANSGKYDVLVSGHTHRAGQLFSKERLPSGTQISMWPVYNTGTWAEGTCSFVAISPEGSVGIFDWIDNQPKPNATKIKV